MSIIDDIVSIVLLVLCGATAAIGLWFIVAAINTDETVHDMDHNYQQAMLSMVDRYTELVNETPISERCVKVMKACNFWQANYQVKGE